MTSIRFRTISRVFAVLLLAWTTADLCGGLCVHDHEPVATAVPAGPHGARSASVEAKTAGEQLPAPPDDCFCCSHYVQPQVRYQVLPTNTRVTPVEAEGLPRTQSPSSRFYHPPLGA